MPAGEDSSAATERARSRLQLRTPPMTWDPWNPGLSEAPGEPGSYSVLWNELRGPAQAHRIMLWTQAHQRRA